MPGIVGQPTAHPVRVEADLLPRPIVAGFQFAYVTLPHINCPAVVEVGTGTVVGWGGDKYTARQDAEMRFWGRTPDFFGGLLAQYPKLNSEYSTTETTCKGCYGPCGRCEKTA